MDGMRVRFAGDTNVGMKRAHNEDAFYLPESERLAIVADGMGGHASGEVASKMAVDTIVGFFKATMDDQQLTWPFKMDHGNRYDTNRMVTAIKLANQEVIDASHTDRQSILLVRSHGPVLEEAWTIEPVSLEDLVLAYMARGTRPRSDQHLDGEVPV